MRKKAKDVNAQIAKFISENHKNSAGLMHPGYSNLRRLDLLPCNSRMQDFVRYPKCSPSNFPTYIRRKQGSTLVIIMQVSDMINERKSKASG